MSNPVTVEDLKLSLPATLKRTATQEMADLLNNIAADPMVAEEVRNNYISYSGVLKDGKFKTEDYIRAVTYVSYKLMGDTNKEAWCKTFPDRHATLAARGATEKELSAHVAGYAKGQLVNKILDQSMVPAYVLNQDIFQQAINQQAWLMKNAQSEKVQSDAANSLIVALKKPDAVKGQIDLNIKDESGINELRGVLRDLAVAQVGLLKDGEDIKTVTDARIIEHEDNRDGVGQTHTG